MRYMLLILEPRGQREARNEEDALARYQEMVRFGEGLAARGQLLASESLRPDRHGVRVKAREGKVHLTDGPFSEAKEMIGGFFLIDCATPADALAIAQTCPAAQWATIELREAAACNAG